ncbi:MAG: hypothetical protein WCY27_00785 [archaeon]|jgi:glutaredoxin|nr:thioredoxin family protein [archaeon]MDD2477405.1 hypothetical protein [Candidatus ainarchaeum sp.]MDD4220763.1 hypothetical protein [Candidatus ainarchaeum sp.]
MNSKNKKTSKNQYVKNTESKSSIKNNMIKSNLFVWKTVSVVLFVAFVLFLVLFLTKPSVNNSNVNNALNQNNVSPADMQNVANETVVFLKENFPVSDLTLSEVSNEKELYKMVISVEGQEMELYTSKDGELIFIPGGAPINKSEFVAQKQNLEKTQTNNEVKKTPEIVKSNKPVVELFVMSHCPYGTQVEKGILPVVELLDDKIDFQLKFVNYAMHGDTEVYEQLLQTCIMQEDPDKFNEYLGCFLEAGDTDDCLERTNISRESLEACITATDEEYNITEMYDDKATWVSGRFPKFLIHDEDNKKYGVQGSPTLVINGTTVSSGRDPQSLLDTICSSFTDKPVECEEQLSSVSPSPGFGYGNSGSNTDAQCN